MATTIITKNGSGAPVAGDLVQGELAVDLTNKTLYSKDSSGNVIKVGDTGGGSSGTFTDLTATVSLTASGLLYPTTDGTEGQAILTDGNGTLAFGDVVGGIDYTTETSNYTLEANQGVIADTTGGTFVVTLPLAPAEGDQVVVADGGDWEVTNLTVGRNGQTIEGVASDLIMDVGGISVTMVYDGVTWQLYPATGTSAGTSYTLDQTTTAGNVTTNDITVGNLTSTGIDDNATSTAITIDSNENVGIGTNAPNAKLDTAYTDSTTYSPTTPSGDIILSRRNSSNTNNQTVGIRFDVTGYSGTTTGGASIQAVQPLNGSSADLAFLTRDSGSWNEAARVDSSGHLLVGATSTGEILGGSINGAYISGESNSAFSRSNTNNRAHLAFYNPNGLVGQISTSGSATTYATSSDARLKRNIVDAPAGNIDAIKVRSYDWEVDGSHQAYGVVAQELFEVAPEAVAKGETDEDTWGVDYSKLVPMMIKEIQDLKAEVAALKGAN